MADKEEPGEAAGGCDVCMVKCWTSEGFFGFGKYSYKYLCMPQVPCVKTNPPLFMGKDEKLPLVLSICMGFQHMLSMVAGIATSGGYLHANEACFPWQKDSAMCSQRAFLVSTSWMTSGALTCIQVFRLKIKGTNLFLGTGMISVMGTSFTFLPLGQEMVREGVGECKANNDPRCVNGDCVGCGLDGYGRFIGTAMVASLLEIVISLLPKKIRSAIFPPVVCGVALMMIGGGLISAGMKYYGGGVFCAQNMASKAMAFGGPHLCSESADVKLVFGAPEYIGLATSVVLFGVIIMMFGSPFLKSTFIFWSLMFGCIVSAIATYTEADGTSSAYWNTAKLDEVGFITFWWVGTKGFIPFGFDGKYLLPMLICSYVTTAETVGDVLMTCHYSKIEDGDEVERRIQGGLLSDGVNSIVAGLLGSPPNTTFSGNNGIIALSRCASRSAGFSCGILLFSIGCLAKLGACFSSIPIPVVGGVVLQTFTMVFVAGLEIVGRNSSRRNSYILMVSLCFGLGVALEPQIFTGNGVSSFYGKNLDFQYGLWPKSMVCEVFPTKTIDVTPSSCMFGTTSIDVSSEVCGIVGGTFTAAVTDTVTVYDCLNNNGFCCLKYNEGMKALRTSLLIVIKTPYAIAPIIAMVLYMILPTDKMDAEEDAPTKKESVETATA